MRITIVGLPGSGKSTLARKISEKLAIPHIHIDDFWFEAGGRQNSKSTPNIEEVRAHVFSKVREAIAGESWVSDGFYSRIQPEIAARANVILFLDIPLWKRLLNHASRIVHPVSRNNEITFWDDIKFFYEIIRRSFTNGPKLHKFLTEHSDKTLTLKSHKEINSYVQHLPI
jgi:adenylate kinase family enzyme